MSIDDGVYVFNCNVYSYVLKQNTQHAFSMTVIFQQKKGVHAVVQSLIIDHIEPSV